MTEYIAYLNRIIAEGSTPMSFAEFAIAYATPRNY